MTHPQSPAQAGISLGSPVLSWPEQPACQYMCMSRTTRGSRSESCSPAGSGATLCREVEHSGGAELFTDSGWACASPLAACTLGREDVIQPRLLRPILESSHTFLMLLLQFGEHFAIYARAKQCLLQCRAALFQDDSLLL